MCVDLHRSNLGLGFGRHHQFKYLFYCEHGAIVRQGVTIMRQETFLPDLLLAFGSLKYEAFV